MIYWIHWRIAKANINEDVQDELINRALIDQIFDNDVTFMMMNQIKCVESLLGIKEVSNQQFVLNNHYK